MNSTKTDKKKKKEEEAIKAFDEILHSNKIALSLLGIWPLDPNTSNFFRIFNKFHVVFMIISYFFFMIIPQWCDLYELRGDLKHTVETLVTNVFVCASAFKFINFIVMAKEFEEALGIMKSNYVQIMTLPDTEENQENKRILIDWTTIARSRGKKYGIILFLAGIAYRIRPFISEFDDTGPRPRDYPFFGRYYIDRDSDTIYLCCYIAQFWTGCLVEVMHYASDTVFFVCVYHACAQFRILQKNISRLGRDEENGIERQKDLIRKHQHEIRNAENLSTVFSISSFQQVMVSCFNICVNGFKLITSLSEGDSDVGQYAVTFPLLLLQVFFYCFPGDQLINESTALDEALYLSYWMNFDLPAKRNLEVMMMRAQRPLMILAGKMFVLSLENFMKIVKTSMSSLSVLRAMYVE